jgi:hypothetical protein
MLNFKYAGNLLSVVMYRGKIMKKLIKWAAAGCAAALLFSSLSFAAPPPPPPTTTTTVTVKPAPPPSGWNVCYKPALRHMQGSRVIQRCNGYYGCQNFRVTREFDVTAYTDCHLEKYSCPQGYRTFGWYPSKDEARDAVTRCSGTFKTNAPMMMPSGGQVRVIYNPGDDEYNY